MKGRWQTLDYTPVTAFQREGRVKVTIQGIHVLFKFVEMQVCLSTPASGEQ
jgi:hypothetical protein